ncbi:MAG: redoxin domain-containing protein [Paracoccaceae bacterium]|jgi:thioredoxin-dependent peroxiredoxin|nr:redoxin domain-containing protein [Paracoccaceae bacterium]
MPVRINEIIPDFIAETDQGHIQFHDWIDSSWAIMFSHPRDFTGVCSTEMSVVAQLSDEWAERNTKVIGISSDSTDRHANWKQDIEALACCTAEFPIISDQNSKLANIFEMLPKEAYEVDGTLSRDARTLRALFIIGPDKKLKLSMFYPSSVGRNWAEVLRALDALQTVAKHSVAMPANWEPGDDVIIPSAVSDNVAKIKFGKINTLLPYVRMAELPK